MGHGYQCLLQKQVLLGLRLAPPTEGGGSHPQEEHLPLPAHERRRFSLGPACLSGQVTHDPAPEPT